MLRSIKRITLCVLLASLTLFTIESGCRFLEPGPFRLKDQFPYVADDQLGQIHKPSSDKSWKGSHFGINSQGFRGPELKPGSTPKLFRVLCIGDSLTFGVGIEEPSSWPRQLEARLQGQLREHDVEVINLAVSGWSGAQYHEAWRRFGPTLVPDLVILGYSLNDLPGASGALSDDSFPERQSAETIFTKLKPAALFRHLRSESLHRDREENWKDLHAEVTLALSSWRLNAAASTRAELAPFIEEIRSSGATPILLSFPHEFQLRSPGADRAPEGTLKMCCSGLKTPFLSMAPIYHDYILKESPGRAALFQRGTLCHPTKAGHEMIAESVLKLLELEALLP